MSRAPDAPRFGLGSRGPRKNRPQQMANVVRIASRCVTNPLLAEDLREIADWIESRESPGAALNRIRWDRARDKPRGGDAQGRTP